MDMTRKIRELLTSKPTVEGAGVKLRRAFGFYELPKFDPFLMLDDFRSDRPGDYRAGFPWHPHRGMDTVTYMLAGSVEHRDSLENRGVIQAGDLQWMTAGSGIIHQEMPKPGADGAMYGFQLWANLPASQKMIEPKYRDVQKLMIPKVELAKGVEAKVISGSLGKVSGPVQADAIDPGYWDVKIAAGTELELPTRRGYTAFAYVIAGEGVFAEGSQPVGNGTVVLYQDGDRVWVHAGAQGVRFLFVTGKPLGEPIAWHGPVVMNTEKEIQTAFDEYDRGTFIKVKKNQD